MWKGKYSERLVHKKMLQLSDEYTIFNNLLFESNGRSTQIDHIVVSPYGVFVIETKGYKGWILGGENSEYWTQVIRTEIQSHTFPRCATSPAAQLYEPSVSSPILPFWEKSSL